MMTANAQQQASSGSEPAVSDPIQPEGINSAGMFSNLTDLSLKRSTKQAVGFYIAYLVFVILAGGLLGGLIGLATGSGDFNTGLTIGTYGAVIFSVGISFIVVYKKNLLGNVLYLILIILSGILALGGGGLLGLIPAAYLTTR